MATPKWLQVVHDLRTAIQTDTYPAGAVLPRETDLAARYGLSRDTIRRALAQLEREGLVLRVRKRGTVVRSYQRMVWRLSDFDHRDRATVASADAWQKDAAEQGRDPSGGTLHVATIPPSATAIAKLGLNDQTDMCVVRSRVRQLDGQPAIINDDLYDERLVRGTALASCEDMSDTDVLTPPGHPQAYTVDEITVRALDDAEATRLNRSPGSPAAEHVRTAFTAAGQAVRVTVSVIPRESLILQYIVPT